MNRDNRSSSNDPTAQPTADQSTQSASGLSSGRRDSRDSRHSPDNDEVVNREGLETPRRYEQPLGDDEDPVMPADDATVNTKI